MKKLEALQATFGEALVLPASIANEKAWLARGQEEFTGSARLSPIEQLDVYREQFWLRHVACLAEDFPTLQTFVGEAAFEAIAIDYLAAHPPRDFMLRNLGAELANFLVARGDALLADLARVEWAFIDAFDAADADPLDPNSVAAITEDQWPEARLTLHPSLQRLRLLHPTHKMREQCRAKREDEALERPEPDDTFLVVYRRELLLYSEEMDALAFEMLERLARGEALGAAGDALAESSGQGEIIEAQIGEWFARWSALGWISRVEVSVPSREDES